MSKHSHDKKEKPGVKRGLRLSRAEKIAIPILLIFAVWGAYSLAQPSSPGQPVVSSSASTGQTAGSPDFTLPVVGANGRTVSLSSFRGKVVFLEFMEPWCHYCQSMAPVLENLYKQYGNNVVFISVAGPLQGATADDTAKFKNDYGSSWTYLYDSSGTVMNMYGITGTPTFFIIGKDGSILRTYQGVQSYNTLASDLSGFSS